LAQAATNQKALQGSGTAAGRVAGSGFNFGALGDLSQPVSAAEQMRNYQLMGGSDAKDISGLGHRMAAEQKETPWTPTSGTTAGGEPYLMTSPRSAVSTYKKDATDPVDVRKGRAAADAIEKARKGDKASLSYLEGISVYAPPDAEIHSIIAEIKGGDGGGRPAAPSKWKITPIK